jgi:hypothetical protein
MIELLCAVRHKIRVADTITVIYIVPYGTI